MAISRSRAQDYAESVLGRPGGETPVTLKRFKSGATLLHRGRALTKTHASAAGALQAELMAEVLGVELPEMGGAISLRVPTGVLYRAVAVSSLDPRKPEARMVLGQLLRTAALQRGAFHTIEVG